MSLLFKLKSSFLSKSTVLKISFIGLDHAGKSSILKRILDQNFDEYTNKRTVGMEVAKFEIAGLQFIAWDIGGQKAFRETVWQSFLLGSKAIIYVIDSTDTRRLQEAKIELENFIFKNPKFAAIPILILANKQDLPNAIPSEELEILLNIRGIKQATIKIFPIIAIKKFLNAK